MSERPVPTHFERRQRVWYLSSIIWRAVHYTAGIAGTICSTIVAATAKGGDLREPVTWLGIVAGVATGLLTFLSAKENANAFMNAWRVLDGATTAYKFGTTLTEHDLAGALKKGEAIIQRTDV